MSRHPLVNPDISFSGWRSTFFTVWFLNAYLLFLFVCLDANSRKTDTKWIAIIITVFIISCYVIHGRIYTWEFFKKMVIIRLVIFVKKESFRGLSTRIFSCFFLCQPPYILIFHFLPCYLWKYLRRLIYHTR